MAPPLTRHAARRRSLNKAARHDYRCGKLWYAARVLRRFTASDLVAVADYPNRKSAQAWLNKLRHAGYFRSSRNGNDEAIWTLIRDSGPVCPAIVRDRTSVWDFNTEKEYAIHAQRA